MEFLTWPLVVLILGGAGLLIYRKPLTRFIDRWRSLKIAGTGIDTFQSGQESAGAPALASGESATPKPIELDTVFGKALLDEYESAIETDLQKRNVPELNQREDLVRQLTQFMIAYRFERTYRNIYGSQLQILLALNTMTEPIDVNLMKPLFNKTTSENPTTYAHMSFEQWHGFLTRESLIVLSGDKIEISVAGREFLKFLIYQGYSTVKFL